MPWDDADTDSLLAGAAGGDDSAVQQLFRRHRARLRQMVAVRIDPRLTSRVDPSDVVQDALAEGAGRLDSYLADRRIPFYPWLRRIAWDKLVQLHRHHVAASRRTVRRESRIQMELSDQSTAMLAERFVSVDSSPSKAVIRGEMRQRVREVLESLSSTDREIIVLRHLEELSFREAAAVMGISLEAAQSRYRRAAVRLHELLTERPIE